MKVSTRLLTVGVLVLAVILGGTAWTFAQTTASTLNELNCTAGQIAKFDGSAWVCADDLITFQARLDNLEGLDPQAQVKKIVYAFEDAYVANDVERVMALYADDVISLPPGRPKMEGKAALEADFQQFFKDFTIQRDFKLIDLQVVGDTAMRRAAWTQTLTPKAGGEPIIETGKCLVGFKKTGGEWKIAWEIWNLDE